MSKFLLHTLGCGSATPTLRHNPSCTVINFRENLIMFDCGEGAQKAMMINGLKFNRLKHIFLTHLHGDHVLGLPGLLSTMDLHNLTGEVVVHTFGSAIDRLKEICQYFCPESSYKLRFEPISSSRGEVVLDNRTYTIRTVPLKHRVQTTGFVLEEKPKPRHINAEMVKFHNIPFSWMNRLKAGMDYTGEDGTTIPNHILTTPEDLSLSYAHISDTIYLPEIAEKIGPVTLLFHETTYLEKDSALAKKHFHTTARQAAQVARDSGSRWLLTGHYSSRYTELAPFKDEAEEVFPNVILNNEGLTVDLTRL